MFRRTQAIETSVLLMEGGISDYKYLKKMVSLFKSNIEPTDEFNIYKGHKRIEKIIFIDGDKCWYCGEKTVTGAPPVKGVTLNPLTATIEHLLPKAHGGIDHIDNCVLSCVRCNSSKSRDMLPNANGLGKYDLILKG